MSALPLLKMFDPEDLAAPAAPEVPSKGDLVSFALEDGSASAQGRVAAVMENGSVKVSVDGVGSFLVPAGFVTILARAA